MARLRDPTLAEDLLVLLFQPDSATIAGENTLFYVLGGAVLADLVLQERVTATTSRHGGVTVETVEGRTPTDDLFRSAWDYVGKKPRGVQAVLDRLVARGDNQKEKRRALGVIPLTVLVEGMTDRRPGLLHDVRGVLGPGSFS